MPQPIYNRDEAERVRDMGILAFQKGDLKTASWAFNKSKKLYELDGIDEWIRKAETGNPPPAPQKPNPQPPPQPNKAPVVEVTYTEDQHLLVKKIIGSLDYYEKLSLELSATDDEIKRQYKAVCFLFLNVQEQQLFNVKLQLALKVHPDKNKAPLSSQAFQGKSHTLLILTIFSSLLFSISFKNNFHRIFVFLFSFLPYQINFFL